ncbi:MAG TPA: aldehyde dehydrogenase family protein [Tissierellia bacterium]|nr:aldehyde dehydrogenase family protein [Tissierellia bacterium]
MEEKRNHLAQWFASGKTKKWDYRLRQLKALQKALKSGKHEIYAALKEDLNKSMYEASMTEMGLVFAELHEAIKNLRTWMKPRRTGISFAQFPGKSMMYPEPYGVVLIVSPWNYPVMLTLIPLIGAIAAGNCVMLKPSANTPATSKVLKELLETALPDTVFVVEGSREENKSLLEIPFDYILFTGSGSVGKEVMRAAAEHLTPVTLELGGKSPVIVDKSAKIAKTARRILFGKLVNSGQTCIAPDYVWVHKKKKDQLVKALIREAERMLKGDFQAQWVRIVNEKHRDRLRGYLEDQEILWQKQVDEELGHLPLTFVDEPSWDSPLMQEEIFGPILPILTFSSIEEVIDKQKSLPKPLALYVFSKSKKTQRRILEELSFGSGCINDTLLQISSSHLPFGGVGESGMGKVHGKSSFDTFTHYKGVLHRGWFLDHALRYMPYKKTNRELWKRLLR